MKVDPPHSVAPRKSHEAVVESACTKGVQEEDRFEVDSREAPLGILDRLLLKPTIEMMEWFLMALVVLSN
jgi:hypothetical protein